MMSTCQQRTALVAKLIDTVKEVIRPTPTGSNRRVDIKNHNKRKVSDQVPVSTFFVLYGAVNTRQCTILKDNDCSTNVMSTGFVEQNRQSLNVRDCMNIIEHFNDGNRE